MLRMLKNLSATDISQPGSRVLRRPGSSQSSIVLTNNLAEISSRSDVWKDCNFNFVDWS